VNDHFEISPEARAAKVEHWERIGVELIRADLKAGGHYFTGTEPQLHALAEEWLLMKDAEKAAAKEAVSPKPAIAGVETAMEEAGRLVKRIWRAFKRP
jgi:hypothetical protein